MLKVQIVQSYSFQQHDLSKMTEFWKQIEVNIYVVLLGEAGKDRSFYLYVHHNSQLMKFFTDIYS